MSKKLYWYGLITFFVGIACLLTLFFLKRWEKSQSYFQMEAKTFSDLPNWHADNLSEAWPAFVRSCQRLNTLSKETLLLNDKPISAWEKICTIAVSTPSPTEAAIRSFFETYFIPYKVFSERISEGMFTGYYEPLLQGSRIKTARYTAPIYKRPNDLVMIEDLGIFRSELKGMRIAGKVVNGNLKPYFTHAEITEGVLTGNELLWIENPIDAFFVQIQGSAAIQLEGTERTRLTYAGTNGHLYTAIGKILIEKKVLTRENVSMQSIRAWLQDHIDEAKALLHQNASFVFFSENKGEGPLGAQGVVLTPGRSLAVDPVYISYGTPVWLDISHPADEKARIQRLVVAQDKGGAIKGPIRGDLFWGTGDEAGEMAGLMKSRGSYYLLLPKSIADAFNEKP